MGKGRDFAGVNARSRARRSAFETSRDLALLQATGAHNPPARPRKTKEELHIEAGAAIASFNGEIKHLPPRPRNQPKSLTPQAPTSTENEEYRDQKPPWEL